MRRLLAVSLLAVAAYAAAPAASQPKQLTEDELEKLASKKDGIFFLDVREPQELEQLGTVKGYVNIPLTQLEHRLSEIPKDKLIVTL